MNVFALLITLTIGPSADRGSPPYPRIALCDALSQVFEGDRIDVVTSGIYKVSFETEFLYDPDQRRCVVDVEPDRVGHPPSRRAVQAVQPADQRVRRAGTIALVISRSSRRSAGTCPIA